MIEYHSITVKRAIIKTERRVDMKRIVLGALLLSLLSIAGSAAAASGSVTMEVSFVVKESCTVQVKDGARDAAPTVACGHNSPYQVTPQAPAQPQAPAARQASLQADGQTWQITF
jgi:type 1 fimbria pilin